MRCTRDILCSQPEHLISRQIRARTVRDEPAWAGDRRHSVFSFLVDDDVANPTFSLTVCAAAAAAARRCDADRAREPASGDA